MTLLLLVLVAPADAGRKKKTVEVPPAEPAAPLQVALPCDWPVGTTFRYDYVRRRTDARDPQLAEMVSHTPTTVEVTASGNPVVFAYGSGQPVFSGPADRVAQMGDPLGGVSLPPMQLVLKDGALTALLNQEEVLAVMEPLVRSLAGDAPADVVDQTLALYHDPVLGQALLLKEPARLFALHCVTMTEGDVIDAPTEFANPFGGPPIAGRSVIRMAGYDPVAHTLTVTTEESTDLEAVRAMLPALVAAWIPGTPEEDMEAVAAQLPPIESRTVGTLVYDTTDGFPLSVEVTQELGAVGHPMRRTDTWSWTRTD
ncbi:MAG: hypothetical protein KC621_27830 [Myxococcales bacterium]|nr:hypothetical protein [Myxococcales bacterium]